MTENSDVTAASSISTAKYTLLDNPKGIEIGGWRILANKATSVLSSNEMEDWGKKLNLGTTSMPEMVFGNSFLQLKHLESGFCLNFNAQDTLKSLLPGPDESIQVADATKWSKKIIPPEVQKLQQRNWTFSNSYEGTLLDSNEQNYTNFSTTHNMPKFKIEINTKARIDIEKLKARDPILFHDDIVLFEDELHDNGISIQNVRLRVMEKFFLCLLRFFLRVDGVVFRIFDVRFYHEFGWDYIIKERQAREDKYQNIERYFIGDKTQLQNIDTVYSMLKVVHTSVDKIQIK